MKYFYFLEFLVLKKSFQLRWTISHAVKMIIYINCKVLFQILSFMNTMPVKLAHALKHEQEEALLFLVGKTKRVSEDFTVFIESAAEVMETTKSKPPCSVF